MWWAPPFDETDNLGPGQVGWGFPDCPGLTAYDVDFPADGVQCDELPCGGELALVTPGEGQVMDCSISSQGTARLPASCSISRPHRDALIGSGRTVSAGDRCRWRSCLETESCPRPSSSGTRARAG